MTRKRADAWITVVGAGPAGMAAARAAVLAGCRVTLVDEAPRPGGQIYRQAPSALGRPPSRNAREEAYKQQILQNFNEILERIEYRAETTAHSLFPGPELHVSDGTATEILRPDAVILATGLCEQAVPFPGWTLPGVLLAGGAQAMMKSSLIRPGDRAVVAGTGPLPLVAADQLATAGAEVRAVALFHPLARVAGDPLGCWAGRGLLAEGFRAYRRLGRTGTALLQGWMPLRAAGDEQLDRVVLARHDGQGRAEKDSTREFEADLLVLSFGFSANSELARMAGVASRYRGPRGGWPATGNEDGGTEAAGVYLAGDCAGLRGAYVAAAEGEIVGAVAAAGALGKPAAPCREARRRRAQHLRFQRALAPLFDLPPAVWDWAEDDTTLCRCEGVTGARLRQALEAGHRTLDGIKRNTRAGMGWCGGRGCLHAVAGLAQRAGGVADIEAMRARPLARPVPLGALAPKTGGRP